MNKIAFLSRVAFLCNLCLLIAWSMKYHTLIPRGEIQSTILIAGLVLSLIINVLVNIGYAFILIKRKSIKDFVPVWLCCINFLFLIIQFYLILMA